MSRFQRVLLPDLSFVSRLQIPVYQEAQSLAGIRRDDLRIGDQRICQGMLAGAINGMIVGDDKF
jgi:hypothetical protein